MTKTLLLPLPGDVDVSDMPHMPLHDQRLLKSRAWLKAKNWRGGGPGLGFCMLNLWTAAFRSVPAGSLDADDDMLAEAARCDIDFWLVMKEPALQGWVQHGDRVWHPVVAEMAWSLWLTRLRARHSNAYDSWRAVCKKATDKGREPPPPPGDFFQYLAAKNPATSTYLASNNRNDNSGNRTDIDDNRTESIGLSDRARDDYGENLTVVDPKRSEAKVITPHLPPTTATGGQPQAGKERGSDGASPDGKRWFAEEFGRLQRELGPMLPLMLSHLNRPGTSSKYVLVDTFKGAWVARGHGNRPEIVMMTKARADAVWSEHGEWMRAHWPDLRIRHATTDEKREQKRRQAA